MDRSQHVITVAVNNTLSHSTIPQGEFEYANESLGFVRSRHGHLNVMHSFPPGFFTQTPDFDFYNYAGILRDVNVYFVPNKVFINDVRIIADSRGDNVSCKIRIFIVGIFNASIYVSSASGDYTNIGCNMRMLNSNGTVFYQPNYTLPVNANGACNYYVIFNFATPWWPKGMGKSVVAYLYTFEVWPPGMRYANIYVHYPDDVGEQVEHTTNVRHVFAGVRLPRCEIHGQGVVDQR